MSINGVGFLYEIYRPMESFYEKRLWSRSQFTGVCEIVSNKKSVQGLKLQAEYEVGSPLHRIL